MFSVPEGEGEPQPGDEGPGPMKDFYRVLAVVLAAAAFSLAASELSRHGWDAVRHGSAIFYACSGVLLLVLGVRGSFNLYKPLEAPMDITVRKPTPDEADQAQAWPIWTCGVSEFDWEYDQPETCLILEGRVTVGHKAGSASFGPGDWVVFPKGLTCRWKVSLPVKKHYRFG